MQHIGIQFRIPPEGLSSLTLPQVDCKQYLQPSLKKQWEILSFITKNHLPKGDLFVPFVPPLWFPWLPVTLPDYETAHHLWTWAGSNSVWRLHFKPTRVCLDLCAPLPCGLLDLALQKPVHTLYPDCFESTDSPAKPVIPVSAGSVHILISRCLQPSEIYG